jgi:hypothetical protein
VSRDVMFLLGFLFEHESVAICFADTSDCLLPARRYNTLYTQVYVCIRGGLLQPLHLDPQVYVYKYIFTWTDSIGKKIP